METSENQYEAAGAAILKGDWLHHLFWAAIFVKNLL
jgi:hypothetical protein